MTSIRKLAKLTTQDRKLLVDAGLVMLSIRLSLWFSPWRTAIARFGERQFSRRVQVTPSRAAWAIRCVSRIVPKATCLTQALTLQYLLTRGGYSPRLTFGVANGEEGFEAHAWVENDGEPLLNERAELSRYSRLLTMERL